MTTTVDIQKLQDAGVHYGYPRTRRHPTAAPFLFGTKDRTDLFDLSQTVNCVGNAEQFVAQLAASGKQLLFIAGKNESAGIVKGIAERIGAPYVAGRWIGGTLTNFKKIRSRIERLESILKDKETGELAKKYTKKEQLLLSREVDGLLFRFGGIVNMTELPGAMFIVDTRHEHTAVAEANQLNIPVIGVSSSDCDFSKIKFPIPANDTAVKSVKLLTETIAEAYLSGRRAPVQK